MKSRLHIEYYITVVIIWIMLLLWMYYMYLQLSSTLFWNQKIETLYETFVGARRRAANNSSADSGPSEYSFICNFQEIAEGKGISFGCTMPVPK